MSSLPTLAVTGGTGFVGAHLIRLAREAGHPVRALTRKWRPFDNGVEWVEGSLDRLESLRRLADGSDAVIHIAGVVNAPNHIGVIRGTVEGTERMLEAATSMGVQRFVMVSSLSAREPQLHFEIRDGRKPVNPLSWLPREK